MRDDPPGQRDLLEGETRRLFFARRHERRPELRGDFPLDQPRDVGVAAVAALFQMKCRDVAARLLVGADDEGQIVVAIDERDAFEERPCAFEQAHANSIIGASTASELPSFAMIFGDFHVALGAQHVLHLHRFDDAERLAGFHSWPCFTEIAFTKPGIGQSSAFVDAPTFLSGISAASSASRRV